ncbi:MAG: C10 family peptidase, partial [Candidatus Cloacimonetes bacterium]|nr:C10 family peptidase [Candidatus Cloacimonadota bacterium]
MKKLCLLTALVLLSFASLAGAPVTEEAVLEVGQKWFRHAFPEQAAREFDQMQSVAKEGQTLYYILSFKDGGFVLVAADDAALPILGYSETQIFEYPVISPEVRYWMSVYEEQIATAIALGLTNDFAKPAWDDIRAGVFDRWPDTRAVGPLLSTTWDQGQYYNQSCPVDVSGPGGHAWAGCAATAMGQVMKYWGHPSQGTGSNSYTDGSAFPPAYGTISANFGATSYSFSSMPNNVTTYNTHVATLLYHCGVAIDMDYGVSLGSGGLVFTNDAMKKIFAYDPAAQWQWRSSFTDPTWKTMMKGDLDLNRPIIYQGYDTNYISGHSFVMDGYNGDYFHFNFGWSGAGNGWYTLDNLIPTGYTNDFSYYQWAYYNIFPGVTVSGTITDAYSNPLNGVTVTFSGAGTATTNSSGFYSMTLSSGYTGTATPSMSGYTFTPASRSYTGLSANQYNQNFSGAQFVPAAPSNLMANVVSWSQIDLNWQDNSSNETGFVIDYRRGTDLNWYFLVNLGADQTFFSDYTVWPGTSYTYRIMAYNTNGNSAYAYSNLVNTPPPPPPINLTTTNITHHSADLNWVEAGGAVIWDVEYGPPGFTPGMGMGIFMPGIPIPFHPIMGLMPSTPYDWFVRSDYGSGVYSPWSGPVQFTTLSLGLPYPWFEPFEAGFTNLVNDPANITPWLLDNTLFSEGVQSAWNAYQANDTNILVTSNTFDLTTATFPLLYFDHIAKTEHDYDHCYVEVSIDGGLSYMPFM